MKNILLIILCISSGFLCRGQKISGMINYEKGGGPAEGVFVRGTGCEEGEYTKSDGMFILDCSNKSPGQKVELIIGNTDKNGKSIVVLNTEALVNLRIPDLSDDEVIKILVGFRNEWEAAVKRYSVPLSQNEAKRFTGQINLMEAQLKKNTLGEEERKTLVGQIDELKKERNAAMDKVEEQAEYIASIDQSQASDLVKFAIEKIVQGREIETALNTIFGESNQQYGQSMDSTRTLQTKFAEMLNRPLDLIEMNLPPADGRYPGTVLVSPQQGQTLAMERQYRPEIQPRASSRVSIALNGTSESKIISKVLGNSSSVRELNIQIDLDDLRMYEVDISTEFKKRLLKNKSIYRAEKNGLKPRTIVRAYEAKISYTINKSSSGTRDVWDKAKRQAIEIGGEMNSDGSVSIKSEEHTVVAFESLRVKFITNNLTSGTPDEVKLNDYLVGRDQQDEIDIGSFNLEQGDPAVSYCAFGNSLYKSDDFGDLKIVGPSTSLVSEVLQKAGATPLMETRPPEVVTSIQMDDLLDEISSQMILTKGKSLFVFYYAGHSIAGPNGQMYLVMEDYVGDPVKDIGENYLYGVSRRKFEDPTSPTSGSGINDLLDLSDFIKANNPKQIDGLFSVSKITSRLESLGVPFLILIDGCYDHEQMNQMRDELSLTQDGDYFGPKMEGGPEEVLQFADAIQSFGNVPQLQSENVVILSSAPGSIAILVPSPRPAFFKRERVGPLAKRVFERFERGLIAGNPISYGDFFYSIVDVKVYGEVRIHGTTSWSDFSVLKGIDMFKEKQ
jgi:hypothetical protein